MKDNCKKYQSFVFVSWQGLISLFHFHNYKLFSSGNGCLNEEERRIMFKKNVQWRNSSNRTIFEMIFLVDLVVESKRS